MTCGHLRSDRDDKTMTHRLPRRVGCHICATVLLPVRQWRRDDVLTSTWQYPPVRYAPCSICPMSSTQAGMNGDTSSINAPNECSKKLSESVSTGVWCVPGFGAGCEITLKPSKLQKEGAKPGKATFLFCAKLWYAPNPGSKEI